MKLISILFVVCISFATFGQEGGHFRHQVGLRPTINQLNIRYALHFPKYLGLHTELGYQGRFISGYSYNGWPAPLLLRQGASSYGYRAEIGASFVESDKFSLLLGFEYRKTDIDKVTNDFGQFGGSIESDYEIYSRNDQRMGLKLLAEFVILNGIVPNIGAGVYRNAIQKNFVYAGTFSAVRPSSRVTKEIRPSFRIHFGITFYPIAIFMSQDRH